jgi:hypothetical protein
LHASTSLYHQETLDLTYEMYQHDFVVFKYSPELSQRKDLKPPALYAKQQYRDTESGRALQLEQMLRDSSRSSVERESMRSNLLMLSSMRSSGPGESVLSSMMKGGNELVMLQEEDEQDSKITRPTEGPAEANGDTTAAADMEQEGVGPNPKTSTGDDNKQIEDDEA